MDRHLLFPILDNHRIWLDEIQNLWLLCLKTKLVGYTFTATWLKGTLNDVPDALSHNPMADPQPEGALAEGEIDQITAMSAAEIGAVTSTEESLLTELCKATDNDLEYHKLKSYITSGFHRFRQQLLPECWRYWNIRTQLSFEDDVILYGCHLLIPVQMRLAQLHDSHQGMVRTKERARLTVYWPSMDNDIDNIILFCKLCQDSLSSQQKEPIALKPPPQRPFQEITADFCWTAIPSHNGLFLWLARNNTNDDQYHSHKPHKSSFCHTSVPGKVWTNQGPQFTYKTFQEFAKQWGIWTHYFIAEVSSKYWKSRNYGQVHKRSSDQHGVHDS